MLATCKSSYRHIVIFQFKADAPAEKVRGVIEAFKALPSKLPAIQAFEWGTNVSPEGLDQGFTHIFTLTFASKEALEKQYLHEPAHQEFVAMLGGVLEKALVVDYNAAGRPQRGDTLTRGRVGKGDTNRGHEGRRARGLDKP